MSSNYESTQEQKTQHIGRIDLKREYSRFGENGGVPDLAVQGFRKLREIVRGYNKEHKESESGIDKLAAYLGLSKQTSTAYSLDQIAENSRKLRESLKQS